MTNPAWITGTAVWFGPGAGRHLEGIQATVVLVLGDDVTVTYFWDGVLQTGTFSYAAFTDPAP